MQVERVFWVGLVGGDTLESVHELERLVVIPVESRTTVGDRRIVSVKT